MKQNTQQQTGEGNAPRAISYKGCRIAVMETKKGFGASINNRILNQFDNTLEHYWFCDLRSAQNAAKQLIDANSML